MPQLSVSVAFLLVLAAVAMFIAFIHNITTTVQVATIIDRVEGGPNTSSTSSSANRTRRRTASEHWSPEEGEDRVPLNLDGRDGTLDHVDYPRLVTLARQHDVVIHLDACLGAFLASGQQVGTVWGAVGPEEHALRDFSRCLGLVRTRTMTQDISFGLRQLVDIAERALSPSMNDPTTAVQVLDEIHVILRALAVRRSISPYIADEDGQVRAVTAAT